MYLFYPNKKDKNKILTNNSKYNFSKDFEINSNNIIFGENSEVLKKLLFEYDLKNKIEQMTLLMLENKEKTFLLEQKKDQTEEINQLKEQLDREKKEQLNEIEKLKNELEKEKNKGFFARLFSK